MAVLNKIRNRSGVLIVVIALALFSFIMMDVIQSGGFSTNRGDTIAKVNGKDIPRDEFMNRVEAFRQNMGQTSTADAVEIVWQDELKNILYNEQYEKLGLSAERNMINDMMRNMLEDNPSFQNEFGQYDQRRVQEYVASIREFSPQEYYNWNAFVDEISQVAKQERYNKLVKGGLITTIAEGKELYKQENDKVNLQFAYVPYSSINDDEVTISENDIKSYIQKHASQFQIEPQVSLRYVTFEEKASKSDEEQIKADLIEMLNERIEYNAVIQANDTLPGFRETTDNAEFVNANSAAPYQDIWYFKKDLPETKADEIYEAEVGTVVGPFKVGEAYILSKVIEERHLPDSVQASHILISWEGLQNAGPEIERTKEEAKTLADSLQNVVKADKAKFAELAETYSSDAANKNKGGDLGYFTMNTMVKPFNDFVFENNVGDVGVVETQFGYHIVSITDQKNRARAIKLANVIQPIEPSEETIQENFSRATKFEVAVRGSDFEKSADEENLEVKTVNGLGIMESTISGLGESRNIISWAYEKGTKAGDFKRFDLINGYVYVQLTSKNDRGLMPVSEASAKVTPILRNQKKAEMIRNSVSATTLQDFASSKGLEIENATAVTRANPRLPEAGVEPKVVGAAFGLDVDATSGLIDGNTGVFMLKVTGKNLAPEIDNYTQYVNQLNAESQKVNMEEKVFSTLKAKAKIEDNRATFY